MSSIPTEKHYYFSRAFQRGVREPFPPGQDDQLAIHFFLIKQSRCWYVPAPTTTDDINCESSIVKRCTSIRFPSANPRPYADIMSLYIYTMGVPREQHPPILDKLFQVIRAAVPDRRVIVLLADVTVRFFGTSFDHHHHHHDNINRITREFPIRIKIRFPVCDDPRSNVELCSEVYVLHDFDYHGINNRVVTGASFETRSARFVPATRSSIAISDIVPWESFETRRARFVPATRSSIAICDRVTWESFETRRVRFVPATGSSIESLQKVRFDSLEEATVKHNSSCAICIVDFAQGGVDKQITPLPCAHYYHLDCIIPWLKTSHMCPMCRYPMPRLVADSGEGASNP